MPKRRTKLQKIKAQQRQPDRIAMIQSQYQFSAPESSESARSKSSKTTNSAVNAGIFAKAPLKSTDLFRYDTRLIYRDIMKTVVITFTMVIGLVIISRFVQ